jgi:hypothetical protein
VFTNDRYKERVIEIVLDILDSLQNGDVPLIIERSRDGYVLGGWCGKEWAVHGSVDPDGVVVSITASCRLPHPEKIKGHV